MSPSPASSSGIALGLQAESPCEGITFDSSKQTPANVCPSTASKKAIDDYDDFQQQCKINNKNASRKTTPKQKKNKEFQCSYCNMILTRRNDLTRHIQRKHSTEVPDQVGNCYCSHCPFKCHKILISEHISVETTMSFFKLRLLHSTTRQVTSKIKNI